MGNSESLQFVNRILVTGFLKTKNLPPGTISRAWVA